MFTPLSLVLDSAFGTSVLLYFSYGKQIFRNDSKRTTLYKWFNE